MSLNLNKSKGFLLSRFKENEGAFGATPLLPPTLEDTFFAIVALKYLQPEFLKEKRLKLLNFLNKALEKSQEKIEHLFQILKICELLEISPTEPFMTKTKEFLTHFIPLPELPPFFLYALWNLGMFFSNKELSLKIQEKVPRYQIKTLEDLYYLGGIDQEIWHKHYEVIIKSQNGDGGFGFYPGTTSFLENTYYALKILHEISSEERPVARGLDFIRACFNGDGGFGRKPGGISYLTTTSMAIEILYLYKGF